jgi:hypothetical protein
VIRIIEFEGQSEVKLAGGAELYNMLVIDMHNIPAAVPCDWHSLTVSKSEAARIAL